MKCLSDHLDLYDKTSEIRNFLGVSMLHTSFCLVNIGGCLTHLSPGVMGTN